MYFFILNRKEIFPNQKIVHPDRHTRTWHIIMFFHSTLNELSYRIKNTTSEEMVFDAPSVLTDKMPRGAALIGAV